MKALGHGADVTVMAEAYGKDIAQIVDFSSNINPFLSTKLEALLPEILKEAKSYPDSHYTKLRACLAKYLGCSSNAIIVGNGATEIMYLLMKSLNLMKKLEDKVFRLGIINPTFSEYERSSKLNGLEVVDFYFEGCAGEAQGIKEIGNRMPKSDEDHIQKEMPDDNLEVMFKVDVESISSQIDKIDGIFVCNPNNPTGKAANLQELVSLLREKDKWLIVDETFMEFVEESKALSLVPMTASYEKLIVIKAVTKFFGLPGIRLGYGVTSSTELMEQMYEVKEPWTVNTFAEQLTSHLLEDEAYIEKSRDYYKEERKRMVGKLKENPALKVYETDTNFILLKIKGMTAAQIKEALFIKKDILVRDASNFKGLDEQFIRVAIKKKEENDQLIKALEEVLGEVR